LGGLCAGHPCSCADVSAVLFRSKERLAGLRMAEKSATLLLGGRTTDAADESRDGSDEEDGDDEAEALPPAAAAAAATAAVALVLPQIVDKGCADSLANIRLRACRALGAIFTMKLPKAGPKAPKSRGVPGASVEAVGALSRLASAMGEDVDVRFFARKALSVVDAPLALALSNAQQLEAPQTDGRAARPAGYVPPADPAPPPPGAQRFPRSQEPPPPPSGPPPKAREE